MCYCFACKRLTLKLLKVASQTSTSQSIPPHRGPTPCSLYISPQTSTGLEHPRTWRFLVACASNSRSTTMKLYADTSGLRSCWSRLAPGLAAELARVCAAQALSIAKDTFETTSFQRRCEGQGPETGKERATAVRNQEKEGDWTSDFCPRNGSHPRSSQRLPGASKRAHRLHASGHYDGPLLIIS